jgi:hypothetical protein
MDPFYQAVIIAQYQRELRKESEERRRAARIAGQGGARLWAGGALIRMGEALAGRTVETARGKRCPARNVAHPAQQTTSTPVRCLPPCVPLHRQRMPAFCTPHPQAHGHSSAGFHTTGR